MNPQFYTNLFNIFEEVKQNSSYVSMRLWTENNEVKFFLTNSPPRRKASDHQNPPTPVLPNTPTAQKPDLPTINDYIESISKPVICALHGNTLGGGLEIALACHYRIAHFKTKIGLPEVRLGLIPGAGGTQRLPRLIGIPEAYKMMASGLPINAKKAQLFRFIFRRIENFSY